MQPWDAYLLYNALNLHFTTDSYDAVRYNYKTSARPKSFFARKDRYFFARLVKKYGDRQQIIEFFVANFTKWNKINTFNQDKTYDETYVQWLRRMDALSYSFGEDTSKLAEHCRKNSQSFDDLLTPVNNVVPVVKLHSGDQISLETVVILDKLTGFVDRASENVSETIFWPEFKRKVHKYSPFIKVDAKKFRTIVLSTFTS